MYPADVQRPTSSVGKIEAPAGRSVRSATLLGNLSYPLLLQGFQAEHD